MTVGEFLASATKTLRKEDIQSARLDTLILLEDVFKKDRAYLLAHPELTIASEQLTTLSKQIARRASDEPLAYIRKRAAFYGRDFIVTPAVLTPRPETEAAIDFLKTLSLPAQPRMADIGTGSGCIGITAALEIAGTAVDLYDISPEALEIAQLNSTTLQARTRCIQSDLLSAVTQSYDVILANLPYVPEHFPINKAATFEPGLALFAGSDGMDAYKLFWPQVASLPEKPRYVITEAFPSQHHTNATLARHAGYYLEKTNGFIQLFVQL